MKLKQTDHYRKIIQQLSEENKILREQPERYSEKKFTELVDETLKMKSEYEQLIRQASQCRDRYEKLLKKQRRLYTEYRP